MDIRKIRGIGQEKRKGPVPVDPTPNEIAEACADIQAGWSNAERERRMGMRKSDGDRWEIPQVRELEGDE